MAEITRVGALAELREHECTDLIQREAIDRACKILAESDFVVRLDGLDLVVIDPGSASTELQQSSYYTQSCASLLHEAVIIVNLEFLAEIEGALRAFASAGSFYTMPQLKSDQALFDLVRCFRPSPPGLVRQPRPSPWPHLKRLRRLTSGYGAPSREGDREEDICEELSLVILFFIAHEVGHLLDGKDARSFGAFLPPGSDLEHRSANAVARLARHVDDLVRREHGLPGFEDMTDPSSEVRAHVTQLEAMLGDAPAQHDEFFADESSADDWANRIIDEHLARMEVEDTHTSRRSAYLLCRGVFGASLYAWYADLLSFFTGIGLDGLSDARSLVLIMMEDRQNYIRAASLFGDMHRNTLTRAEIVLEAVLQNRTDWFEHCEWSRSRLDIPGPEEASTAAQEKWWLEETVLRFCLLGIIVDTVVKLAYVGAASSWWEQNGVPSLLMMNFETIERAVSRISKGGN